MLFSRMLRSIWEEADDIRRLSCALLDYWGDLKLMEGTSIRLRPLDERDLDAMYRWHSDTELIRYMQAYQDPPITHSQIEKRIQKSLAGSHDRVDMIIESKDGQRAGVVYLQDIDYRNRKAEIGVIVGEHDQQGKGMGTEAVEMILQVGFERLSLHRIYGSIDPANVPSIRVFENLGFTRDGALREDWWANGQPWDAIIYSMLSHEYFARHERGN